MHQPKLADPRPKRAGNKVLQQSLPIPVSSLTGVNAGNDVWRWYYGTLVSNRDDSLVKAHGSGSTSVNPGPYVQVSEENGGPAILAQMGFFGRELVPQNDEVLVRVVEDFDLPDVNGQSLQSCQKPQDSGAGEAKELQPQALDYEYDEDETRYALSLEEAFFLSFGLGCLLVDSREDPDAHMDLDTMWRTFCSLQTGFPQRYLAYHHFRTKGWIVRDGVKFGNDFLIYKDGPPFYHASYSVTVKLNVQNGNGLNVGKNLDGSGWADVMGLNRVTESAAKELLILEVNLTTISDVDTNFQEAGINSAFKCLLHGVETNCSTQSASQQSKNEHRPERPSSLRDNGTRCTCTVTDWIKSAKLREVLVRRWLPSVERQDDFDAMLLQDSKK